MEIKFEGEINSVLNGIKVLGDTLGFEVCQDGIPVKVELGSGNIEVGFKHGNGFIKSKTKNHFFRALGLLVENLQKGKDFHITEEPQFEMNGIMADVSRNAVLTVESIKKLLEIMAVMGLNMMMLYMEDTYEVPGRPYFGYMRGRYSYDELKECDDYANMFGIEIIPCIQTLAHLEQVLKWNYANNMKDTSDILLAECDETYHFIEEMIKAASAPFRSKRIHLGMDEAHNLGLGRYLDKHGYKRRFDIMSSHLNKVKEITDKYGLKPMIWSDMYFRLGSKTGDYYDVNAVIPQDVIKEIPDNMGLVYWDYYHNEEDSYSVFLRKHKDFGKEVIFAGGIWTWNGICVNYGKTFTATNAALASCKKEGIKMVFATIWGDNGAETNIFNALLGMQLYAEHGYAKEIRRENLKERFEFCTKGKYDAFMELSKADTLPGQKSDVANPSKYLLWQDILIGMFDRHVEYLQLGQYYSDLQKKMQKHIDENAKWKIVYEMPCKLCSVLSIKSTIGVEIKNCYDRKDTDALRLISQEKLVVLFERVEELRLAHKEQWFKTQKPFGWEIIDIRYGGLLARVNTAITRITEYLNGEVERLEELEAERLYFDCFDMPKGPGFGYCNLYHRIISASPIG